MGALPDEFVNKIIMMAGSQASHFHDQVRRRGKNSADVVGMNVSQGLLRAMQALFNDDEDVMRPGGFNLNVYEHVQNIDGLDNKFPRECKP